MKTLNEYLNPVNEEKMDGIEERLKSSGAGNYVIDMFKRHFNTGYEKVEAYMLANIICAMYTDLKK